MSMMMPPDPSAVPNLPIAPGGGDTPPPPMDQLNQGPIPADPGGGGMEGLLSSLAGAGGGPPGQPEGDMTTGGSDPSQDSEMDSKEHIQQAMKHLLMALAKEDDEQASHGITKGMGALQGILAGEQKKNALIGG